MDKACLDGNGKRRLQSRLGDWFEASARDLPWRRNTDPYAVWISEMMLQQTQVATVIPYFIRFIDRFPDITELAQADEAEVLRHWEGLGYYRRARALHAAARRMALRHGGCFPQNWEDVLALPGIGRYTAGAVLSIAFDQRRPILEANTRRLFARLMAMRGDLRSPENERRLWEFAEFILPRRKCGDFNQALMELGATVCTPKRPKCERCPLASLCQARRSNLQDSLPSPTRGKTYEDVLEGAAIVRRRGRVLLRQSQPGERWSGLWDFPRAPLPADAALHRSALECAAKTATGATVRITEALTTMRHSVTRFRIELICYRGIPVGKSRLRESSRWADVELLDEYPLNATARRLARLLRTQTS